MGGRGRDGHGRRAALRYALAGVGEEVKVPAHEKAGGGGQPCEAGPYPNVRVPRGGQVSASTRDVAARVIVGWARGLTRRGRGTTCTD
jgi:hypothetical protein